MPYAFDEPNMSDATLLVSVEDLINIGLGPPDVNVVNFKVLQTVLHILARQQRMLQQRVEIRITDRRQESSPPRTPTPRKKSKKIKEIEASESSSSKSPRSPPLKRRMAEIKEERDDKTKDKAEKEQAKPEKEKLKAEKEKMKAEKDTTKAEKARVEREAQKEKEKELKALEQAEKSARKEKEKAEKAHQKELEKTQKEKEKAERAALKEQEKAEKAAAKEKEKAEKAERKEKERVEKETAQKEKERSERSQSPAPKTKPIKKTLVESVSSISVSEVERDKGTVLVVEKGPTTRSESRGRSASIDVVTQSQFALLEAAVGRLQEAAAPLGRLRMPDNDTLRGDLVKGSASLTDTMHAMQVNSRVKAAEDAIERMAGLLTQLAAAGALPGDAAATLATLEDTRRDTRSGTGGDMPIKPRPSAVPKSVAIDPMAKSSQTEWPAAARGSALSAKSSISKGLGRTSVKSQPSSTLTSVPEPGVTREEMEDLIKAVKDDLWKNMNNMTNKAAAAAESALHTAKTVAEKLDVALKLDVRISSLYSLVADYAEQLSGFDAGLTTQMQSFQEQIAHIRNDLKGGLNLLESVNNNAETAAVMELKERYEELASELERTVTAHNALNAFQSQLADELHSLLECIEMLREQKADRDEVIDGLRDKADTSRLAGLLTDAEFAAARAQLSARLDACYDKFHRQDSVWMGAIKDLLKTTDLKAEFIDLLSMKDDTQRQLQELQDKLKLLAMVLGEPKAALLTRQLADGATCGACGAPALMSMRDPAAGQPPPLPALRPHSPPSPPPPLAAPALPCLAAARPSDAQEDRHMCQRWCGGSHTLLSERTTREGAAPPPPGAPTRRFADYGLDGRLYMMEEELQPCAECNEPLPGAEAGAGDHGRKTTTILHVKKEL